MAKLTSLDHLENIMVSLNRIAFYVSGLKETQFEDDIKTKDAVYRCIEILGFSSSQLPKELTGKYPQISWAMINMLCVQNCFSDDDLWSILHDQDFGLLKYKAKIERILENEQEQLTVYKNSKNKLSMPEIPEPTLNVKINLTMNYKYPIKTSSSIWTVKKR